MRKSPPHSKSVIKDDKTTNWLDQKISWFKSIKSTVPKETTLKLFLNAISSPEEKSNKYSDLIREYRLTGDKTLKNQLPVFCPGALLKTRSGKSTNEEKIITKTGAMQFDIDNKDNPHIKDFEKLRDKIFQNEQIAFCSLSASGKGLWGLIIVSDPEDYRSHFQQLKQDFEWHYNITLDKSKGGNPTDLRFYSHDQGAKLRAAPKVYDRKSVKKKGNRKNFNFNRDKKSHPKRIVDQINLINQRGIDIAPDYLTYRNVGFALCSEFGESGRSLFHLLCEPHVDYDFNKTNKQYDSCLQSKGEGITIATLIQLLNEHLNR